MGDATSLSASELNKHDCRISGPLWNRVGGISNLSRPELCEEENNRPMPTVCKKKSFKEAINNDLAIAALALLPNRSLSRPIHLDGDREKNENFLIAFQHF